MAKLYLKFKESVIREIILPNGTTTIGRAEKNDLHIDNLAVSGNHARIAFESGKFIIEDLNSTNGTYINDRRISRQQLFHNAIITVGKHTLLFYDPAPMATDSDQTVVMCKPASCDATVVITPAKLTPAEEQTIIRGTAATMTLAAPPVAEKLGILSSIDGTADSTEYLLDKRLVTIGKADSAEIKLKGFFAPKVAAVINRTKDGYYITPAAGEKKLLLNGRPISGASQLKPLDMIEVASLRLQFSFREGG